MVSLNCKKYMDPIETHIHQIRNRIFKAERRYHRPPGSVTLIAVTKSQPFSAILAALAANQQQFAENYLQEAIPKIKALQLHTELVWHFIGPIQSNKAPLIAQHFSWVHSIDRLNIATLLNKSRTENQPLLNVCIQVNIHAEPNKSGIPLDELPTLASALSKLPRLKLRGLMCIPPFTRNLNEQRKNFALCREAFTALQQTFPSLDTLSMGMSNDLESAIAENSTMVRIGTAIFGPRSDLQYRPSPSFSNKVVGPDSEDSYG